MKGPGKFVVVYHGVEPRRFDTIEEAHAYFTEHPGYAEMHDPEGVLLVTKGIRP
jgi:hypothetical protein